MQWVGHSDPHLLIRCHPRPCIAWRKAPYSRRALPPEIPTRRSCDGCCAPARRGCAAAAENRSVARPSDHAFVKGVRPGIFQRSQRTVGSAVRTIRGRIPIWINAPRKLGGLCIAGKSSRAVFVFRVSRAANRCNRQKPALDAPAARLALLRSGPCRRGVAPGARRLSPSPSSVTSG